LGGMAVMRWFPAAVDPMSLITAAAAKLSHEGGWNRSQRWRRWST